VFSYVSTGLAEGMTLLSPFEPYKAAERLFGKLKFLEQTKDVGL
jgi:hypothetical protein